MPTSITALARVSGASHAAEELRIHSSQVPAESFSQGEQLLDASLLSHAAYLKRSFWGGIALGAADIVHQVEQS
jgi:hypothetical protein